MFQNKLMNEYENGLYSTYWTKNDKTDEQHEERNLLKFNFIQLKDLQPGTENLTNP